MTDDQRPRYTLDELLDGSDYQDLPNDQREWLDAPPVGDELI